MEIKSLIFVLIGSLLHLGWNVLAKKSVDKLAFLWLALVIPGIIGGYFFYQEILKSIPQMGWICIITSGVVHSIYFATLSKGYEITDISIVYPYSRGISTLLTTLIGAIALRENLTILGYTGIATTIIATVSGPLLEKKNKTLSLSGFGFSVITGIMIAIYLVFDKIALKYIDPFNYLMIVFFMMFACLAPFMIYKGRFAQELSRNKALPFVASIFMGSAYLFVLFAMKDSPVSYVVAARASGIIVSGVAGVLFFKELVSKTRWLSIGLICIGVVLIGLA